MNTNTIANFTFDYQASWFSVDGEILGNQAFTGSGAPNANREFALITPAGKRITLTAPQVRSLGIMFDIEQLPPMCPYDPFYELLTQPQYNQVYLPLGIYTPDIRWNPLRYSFIFALLEVVPGMELLQPALLLSQAPIIHRLVTKKFDFNRFVKLDMKNFGRSETFLPLKDYVSTCPFGSFTFMAPCHGCLSMQFSASKQLSGLYIPYGKSKKDFLSYITEGNTGSVARTDMEQYYDRLHDFQNREDEQILRTAHIRPPPPLPNWDPFTQSFVNIEIPARVLKAINNRCFAPFEGKPLEEARPHMEMIFQQDQEFLAYVEHSSIIFMPESGKGEGLVKKSKKKDYTSINGSLEKDPFGFEKPLTILEADANDEVVYTNKPKKSYDPTKDPDVTVLPKRTFDPTIERKPTRNYLSFLSFLIDQGVDAQSMAIHTEAEVIAPFMLSSCVPQTGDTLWPTFLANYAFIWEAFSTTKYVSVEWKTNDLKFLYKDLTSVELEKFAQKTFGCKAQVFHPDLQEFEHKPNFIVENATKLAKSFYSKMKEFFFLGVTDSLKHQFFEFLKTNKAKLINGFLDLFTIYFAYRSGWDTTQLSLLVLTMARHTFPSAIDWVIDSVMHHVSKPFIHEAGHPVWLLGFVTATIGSYFLDYSVNLKTLQKFSTSMTLYEKTVDHTTSLLSFLISYLPESLQKYFDCVITNDCSMKALKLVQDLEDMHHFVVNRETIKSHYMSMFMSKMIELQYMRTNNASDWKPGVTQTVNQCIAKYSETYQNFTHRIGTCDDRYVPFWISFIGEPGYGKSEFSGYLKREMVNAGLFPGYDEDANTLDHASLSYSRCCGQEFWNGYCGQPIVEVDDWGSTTDDVIYQELLLAHSNVAFNPNMASLNDPTVGIKGTFFTSICTITSSNCYRPSTTKITNIDALLRRRCVTTRVVCDDRVYDKVRQRIDETKRREIYGDDHWGHLQFLILKPNTQAEEVIGQLTTTAFVKFVVDEFKKHSELQKKSVDRKKPSVFRMPIKNTEPDDIKQLFDMVSEASGKKYHEIHEQLKRYVNGKKANVTILEDIENKGTKDIVALNDSTCGKECKIGDFITSTILKYKSVKSKARLVEGDSMDKLLFFLQTFESLPCGCHGNKWNKAIEAFKVNEAIQMLYNIDILSLQQEISMSSDKKNHITRFINENHSHKGDMTKYAPIEVNTTTTCPSCYLISLRMSLDLKEDIVKGYSKMVYAIQAIAACGIAVAAYKFYKDCENKVAEVEQFITESDHNIDHQRQKIHRFQPKLRAAKGLPEFERQSSYDASFQIARRAVASVLFTQGTGKMSGGCIRLKGTWIAFPYHYVQVFDLTKPLTMSIFLPNQIQPSYITIFEHDRCRFYYVDESKVPHDLVLYEGAPEFPLSKDNIPFFMTNDDLDKAKSEAFLIGKKDLSPAIDAIPVGVPSLVDNEVEKGDVEFELNCNAEGWTYNTSMTKSGDCGRILTMIHPTRPFVGMHVGKFSKNGICRSEIITQEMLQMHIKGDVMFISEGSPLGLIEDMPNFKVPYQVNLIGRAEKRFAVHMPEETSLVTSPLSKVLNPDAPWGIPTKEPSILSKKDPRHKNPETPLFLAINKYKVGPEPDEKILKDVYKWTLAELLPFKPALNRVLTEDEAINGIDGLEYCDAIPNSAPGHPYIKFRPPGKVGRYWMFSEQGRKIVQHKVLRKRLDEREFYGRQRQIYGPSVWIDVLKDEKLKIAKIATSSTRLFSIAPTDHLILCKRYFGAFTQMFHAYHDEHFGSPGLNVRSNEWDIEFKRLAKISRLGLDGDVKEWDGTMRNLFIVFALYVIEEWYKHWDPNWSVHDQYMRETLMYEAMHAIHLAVDAFYQTHCGMMSGIFLTAVLNCILNDIMCKYCYKKTFPHATHFDWLVQIALKVWGDDHRMAIKQMIQDLFNGNVIAKILKEMNIQYTPADKSSTFGPCKDLLELEYLKCYCFKDPGNGIVYPKVDYKMIDEILNWVRTPHVEGVSVFDQSVLNANAALGFMIYYGRTKFAEYRDAIITILKGQGKIVVLDDFDEIVDKMVQREHYGNEVYSAQWYTTGSGAYKRMKIRWPKTKFMYESSAPAPGQPVNDTVGFGTTIITNKLDNVAAPDEKTGKISHVAPLDSMESVAISYSNIANKWVRADQFQWTQSTGSGTPIKLYNLPMDLVVNCQQEQGWFNNYLWRGDIEVEVVVDGTQFHQGLIMVCWVPGVPLDIASTRLGNSLIAWSQTQSAVASAHNPSKMRLYIPYSHPENFLATNSNNNGHLYGTLGTLAIVCMVTLQAGPNSTATVPVSVFVKFPKSIFKLPVLTDTCSLLAERRTFNRRNQNVERGKGKFLREGGNNSKVTNITYENIYGSNIAENGDRDEFVNSNQTDLSVDAQTGGTDLDRPFYSGAPMSIFNRPTNNFNQTKGVLPLEKLTLVNNEQCPAKHAHFGRTFDEMSIKYLASISSVFNTLQWSTSQGNGTQLFGGYILPAQWCVNVNTATSGSSAYVPTLDYLTSGYTFWRGRQILNIKIAASKFDTGSLSISAGYYCYTPTISLSAAECQWNAFINLTDEKRDWNFTFEFPTPIQALLTTTTPTAHLGNPQYFAVGSYYIHVVNPLTVGNDNIQNVALVMSWSAPEIEFFHIIPANIVSANFTLLENYRKKHLKNDEFQQYKDTFLKRIKQADLIEIEDLVPEKEKPITKARQFIREAGTGVIPKNEVTMNQSEQSMNGVLLGPGLTKSMFQKNMAPIVSLQDQVKRFVPISLSTYACVSVYGTNGPHAWVSNLYAARRGNTRFRIVGQPTNSDPGGAWWWQPFTSTAIYSAVSELMNNPYAIHTNKAPVLDFETSFTSPMNWLIANEALQEGNNFYYVEGDLGNSNMEAGPASTLSIHGAGGDDVRFGLFIGPGYCVVNY